MRANVPSAFMASSVSWYTLTVAGAVSLLNAMKSSILISEYTGTSVNSGIPFLRRVSGVVAEDPTQRDTEPFRRASRHSASDEYVLIFENWFPMRKSWRASLSTTAIVPALRAASRLWSAIPESFVA